MAASSSATNTWSLVQNAPVIVRWTGEDNTPQYLGRTPSDRVSAVVNARPALRSAVFNFRVPVGLKEGGKEKVLLHVFIYPEHIQRIDLLASDTVTPEPALGALIKKMDKYESPNDIVGIRLSLKQNAIIVGPASMSTLTPKTKAAKTALATLHSLAQITKLTFFAPRQEHIDAQIQDFCRQVRDGELQARGSEYNLGMLYLGAGGQDIGSLLSSLHDAELEEPPPKDDPPSYDELALTPPPRRPMKRLPPGRISPPQAKRRGKMIDTRPSASDLDLMRQELSNLAAKVVDLQERLDRQEAERSPAQNTNFSNRLGALEGQVLSFKTRLDGMEAMLQERLDSLEERVHHQVAAGCEARLQEELESVHEEINTVRADVQDARDETSGEVNNQLDDMLVDIKHEIQDWSREELRAVVNEQLGEVVEDCLDQASFHIQR